MENACVAIKIAVQGAQLLHIATQNIRSASALRTRMDALLLVKRAGVASVIVVMVKAAIRMKQRHIAILKIICVNALIK